MLLRRSLLKSRVYLCKWCRHCHDAKPEVRVRFGPSPTGQLHLGGLRTALYNFLFARKHGGKMLLRIEDTDQTRLVPGAMEKLVEVLDWAGIEIDEGPFQGGPHGPYIQSQRKGIYWEKIQHLLQNGSAYYCFCTSRRLELLKKEQLRTRETPRYDNRCRHLTEAEVEEKLHDGLPYVIRLRLPDESVPWQDMILGSLDDCISEREGDPVLIKSDRFPTYHFANVVDDHMMRISHVLRGVEWHISTSKHLLLYKAFGWKPPQFAHLPLLLNKDGSKLSKRQNDLHVEHFKRTGHFPEALTSFLCSRGSGFGHRDTSRLSQQELIQAFDLSEMKNNSIRVDFDRIPELNQLHLSRRVSQSETDLRDMVTQVQQMLQDTLSSKAGGQEVAAEVLDKDYVKSVLLWATSEKRICFLKDLVDPSFHFLWSQPRDETLHRLAENQSLLPSILSSTHAHLSDLTFNSDLQFMNEALQSVSKEVGLKHSKYMQAMRLALTGLKVGPPVAEVIVVLGKEIVLRRLKHAMAATQGSQESKKCS